MCLSYFCIGDTAFQYYANNAQSNQLNVSRKSTTTIQKQKKSLNTAEFVIFLLFELAGFSAFFVYGRAKNELHDFFNNSPIDEAPY